MKTWRERIAEARERGEFTDADISRWAGASTCLIGETVSRVFGIYSPFMFVAIADAGLHEGTLRALRRNDYDWLDDRLDAIEDRALQLKREQAG